MQCAVFHTCISTHLQIIKQITFPPRRSAGRDEVVEEHTVEEANKEVTVLVTPGDGGDGRHQEDIRGTSGGHQENQEESEI